jgi:hypothetical protein
MAAGAAVDAMGLELQNLRQRIKELEIVADLAAGLSTSQDCDPAHHGLVCAAMAALNYPENDQSPSVGATGTDHE